MRWHRPDLGCNASEKKNVKVLPVPELMMVGKVLGFTKCLVFSVKNNKLSLVLLFLFHLPNILLQ
jgi:hypothetical protein